MTNMEKETWLMDSNSMKKTVEKEVTKLNVYADMINENMKDRNYVNLRRLSDVTFPEKPKVVGELFIDEEKSMEEFHNWSGKVKRECAILNRLLYK